MMHTLPTKDRKVHKDKGLVELNQIAVRVLQGIVDLEYIVISYPFKVIS
jgi:hypothetical protein